MEFTNIDYTRIENALLNGGKLNKLQKEFIELFESKTIIAGPGTGKTTSIAAKVALMLIDLNRNSKNEGICIITHTNVAVNEINSALQKTGVGKIKHPHFIGTIHEFFNRFCVLPFFKITFKNNNLYFPDKNQNDHDNIDTYTSFLSRKYSWMKYDVKMRIASRIDRSNLIINPEDRSIELENTTNWDKFDKYKDDMFHYKIKRKSQGFLTHDDTFLFAEYFLFSERILKILRSRFKYVFIDEFQDTNKYGEKLLDKVFKTDTNIIQKIGDPFQTIGFGEEIPQIKEEEIFRLNVSNRFGSALGTQLNIIIPEAKIETIENITSYNPILLGYNNPETVGDAYNKIIESFSKKSVDLNNTKKRDSILVLRKASTKKYFNVDFKEDKKRKKESIANEMKKLIVKFIHKKIMEVELENSREVRKWILNHKNIHEIHSLLIDVLKIELNENLTKKIRDQINAIFLEKEIKGIELNNTLFNDVRDIKNKAFDDRGQKHIEDQISTIHSVKGETHRSVLLLDFETKPLTKILMNRYLTPEEVSGIDFINRNLLYVAMSRPTHLFIYAINEEELTDDVVSKFRSKNWDIKFVQEYI